MRKRDHKRQLQKTLNHMNKSLVRMRSMGLDTTTMESERAYLLKVAKTYGIKLRKKGLPK